MRCLSLVLVALFATSLHAEVVKVPTDATALRIRFGMKDQEGTEWDGKLALSKGTVEHIRGWRWGLEDAADGASWKISTRRAPQQSRADKLRVDAGNKMPMNDNGMIVTLAGVDDATEITFDAKPGKHTFKLGDVPFGKTMMAMDDNLKIERIPVSTTLAQSNEDEDYPTVATAKDGTVYIAYLSFKHGKDFQGVRERPATPESGPNEGPNASGEIRKIEKPEDFDYLAQPAGGEQIYLRVMKDGAWSEPIAVTDGKQELYRPAIAVDGKNRVWVFYSANVGADKKLENGNWEMMARSFDADGKNPAEPVNISNAEGTDFMPAATMDSDGNAWVTWVGGRKSNFNIFAASQDGEKFSAPQRLTKSNANEWEPSIAADAKGNLAVAWDTYAKGDYDVQVATRNKDGKFNEPQDIAATLGFEVRPSLAYDRTGRLWIAFEQSGDMWGKDFGPLKKEGIPLYQTGRSIAVKTLDADGKWSAPADVMDAMPGNDPKLTERTKKKGPAAQPSGAVGFIAPCYPRIASDPDGGVWLSFRGRPGGNWRVPVGSVWCEYVTRLNGEEWTDAVWVPRSNAVLDNRPAVTAQKDQLLMVYSGDGRGEMNPPKVGDPHLSGSIDGPVEEIRADATSDDDNAVTAAATQPANERQQKRAAARAARGGGRKALDNINVDLFATTISSKEFGANSSEPKLTAIDPAKPAAAIAATQEERDAIKAMRDFRINLNGEELRIWRGEFHRHTEYSPDGGSDGGLLDMWRYAIDAANLDWIGDGDHDYGIGREYTWWTTQKAVTLFTIPETFVPMYSYERSVSYPEGHRNCMFAHRGVRSLPRLPITSPDDFKPAPDTNMLYKYLKHFDGLCASHTSATDMGTDWRNNDPEVEPFVEIYQGDRNNYERPDSPRSAVTEAKLKQSTPEKESLGGWQPKGFVNLALKKGYRLAFQSSSDHISTHLSYCNVLVKEPTREGVIEAIKKRRVYGATDNIIADVRCNAGGKDHLMGEEFSTDSAPTLKIHFIGCYKIAKVTIIKDDEEVHVITPNEKDVSFTWTDPKPSAGKTSYYYVRGEQAPDMEGASSGELVWASPMWIKYEGK